MSENYFGRQAKHYKAARPQYPAELFRYVAGLAKDHDVALDVGCGNGQATVPLTQYFNRVVGLDESAAQLANATKDGAVDYIHGSSNELPVTDNSIDLLTVAEALHWFDLDRFYEESARVIKPGGALASWVYYMPRVTKKIDFLTKDFFEHRLGHYVDQRRQWVIDLYETLPFPLAGKKSQEFQYSIECDLERFKDIFRSSSLVKRELEKTGADPVLEIEEALENAWGPDKTRIITWDMNVLSGRKPV